MPAAPREGAELSAAAFAAQFDVSRETLARLSVYLELLQHWQQRINLVGASTMRDPWRRHILDSAQLLPHLPPKTNSLIDLGSGAGLPGMVLALLGVQGVHLIEANRRKAEFLRAVARATAAEVTVHGERAEQLAPWPADVVTARALAPLPRLLALAAPFLGANTTCLFLKGRSVEHELTAARKSWHMMPRMFASLSEPSSVVLELRGIGRASDRQS